MHIILQKRLEGARFDRCGTPPYPLPPVPVKPRPLRRRRHTCAAMVGQFSILIRLLLAFAEITDCLGVGVIPFTAQTVVRTLYTTTRHVQQHFLFTSYDREHDARVLVSSQQLYVITKIPTTSNSKTTLTKCFFSFDTQHHK